MHLKSPNIGILWYKNKHKLLHVAWLSRPKIYKGMVTSMSNPQQSNHDMYLKTQHFLKLVHLSEVPREANGKTH